MKYFLDTEFHEFKKKPFIGKPIDTIELISIGIVAEDGRGLYLISKDFDIKAAWNNEWLRNNVLKSIYYELMFEKNAPGTDEFFSYKTIKQLINKYGKTNKEIAEKVKLFVSNWQVYFNVVGEMYYAGADPVDSTKLKCEFYGYYSDYDWVVFCWLFGRMIDLPKGFPMYCIDLKQELDNKANAISLDKLSFNKEEGFYNKKEERDLEGKIEFIKSFDAYPKETDSHHALHDAKWNLELYKFLKTI